MNEVVISKKRILVGVLILILLIGVGFLIPFVRRFLVSREAVPNASTPSTTTATTDGDRPAQAAALAGAQAFYTVDTSNGQQTWLDHLCAVSTNAGCAMDQNVFVPALWPQLEAAKTATTVQVSVQAKVLDQINPLGNAPQQVWRLGIQLSAPWVVQKQPLTSFPALALVTLENGVWKFERFLTEDEAQALDKKAGQP
jgi:hypothetical protein